MSAVNWVVAVRGQEWECFCYQEGVGRWAGCGAGRPYMLGRDERGVYVEFAQILIPEPAVVGLGSVAVLMLVCRRRRKG